MLQAAGVGLHSAQPAPASPGCYISAHLQPALPPPQDSATHARDAEDARITCITALPMAPGLIAAARGGCVAIFSLARCSATQSMF